MLLFIFSPASSRNPYTRTISSCLRKCIEHSPFCSTVGERTMANPPPEIWLCHECGAGPHLLETTLACTGVHNGVQCGHKVCGVCKKNKDIPSTIGTVALRSPLTPPGMRRTAPAMAPRGNKRALDRGQYHQPALRLSAPPLTGWWICSNCKNNNNPALTDGRCSVCNHARCRDCRPWTR